MKIISFFICLIFALNSHAFGIKALTSFIHNISNRIHSDFHYYLGGGKMLDSRSFYTKDMSKKEKKVLKKCIQKLDRTDKADILRNALYFIDRQTSAANRVAIINSISKTDRQDRKGVLKLAQQTIKKQKDRKDKATIILACNDLWGLLREIDVNDEAAQTIIKFVAQIPENEKENFIAYLKKLAHNNRFFSWKLSDNLHKLYASLPLLNEDMYGYKIMEVIKDISPEIGPSKIKELIPLLRGLAPEDSENYFLQGSIISAFGKIDKSKYPAIVSKAAKIYQYPQMSLNNLANIVSTLGEMTVADIQSVPLSVKNYIKNWDSKEQTQKLIENFKYVKPFLDLEQIGIDVNNIVEAIAVLPADQREGICSKILLFQQRGLVIDAFHYPDVIKLVAEIPAEVRSTMLSKIGELPLTSFDYLDFNKLVKELSSKSAREITTILDNLKTILDNTFVDCRKQVLSHFMIHLSSFNETIIRHLTTALQGQEDCHQRVLIVLDHARGLLYQTAGTDVNSEDIALEMNDSENVMRLARVERTKRSVENLCALIPKPDEGEVKSLLENLLILISKLESDNLKKRAFHVLIGDKKSGDFDSIFDNEFFGTLMDGSQAYVLDIVARIIKSINSYQDPLGSQSKTKKARKVMMDNFIKNMSRCIEEDGHRVCYMGKVQRLLLTLQGEIPGIQIDRDEDLLDPKADQREDGPKTPSVREVYGQFKTIMDDLVAQEGSPFRRYIGNPVSFESDGALQREIDNLRNILNRHVREAYGSLDDPKAKKVINKFNKEIEEYKKLSN